MVKEKLNLVMKTADSSTIQFNNCPERQQCSSILQVKNAVEQLPREVVDAPTPEVFKARLHGPLSNMI